MRRPSSLLLSLAPLTLIAACATQAPTRTNFLGDPSTLQKATDTVRAQIERRRQDPVADAIKSVVIEPVVLAPGAERASGLEDGEIATVVREVERQLCYDLSRLYRIADATDTEAARVRAQVTRIQRTNAASSVASAAISLAIPGPLSVRLPLGRGGLSVEAKLEAADGSEAAAMSWSRGAGIANDDGSASEVGDAYRFAEAFAADFTKWIAGDAKSFAVPEPDPCAAYGPRLALGRAAVGAITGLTVVPDAPVSQEAPKPNTP